MMRSIGRVDKCRSSSQTRKRDSLGLGHVSSKWLRQKWKSDLLRFSRYAETKLGSSNPTSSFIDKSN